MSQNTHIHTIERRFILALILTALILAAEIVGGLLTGSLALLSDAAHVLMDVLALMMSYAALRIARRPADERHTYGYHRWQVIAALANGVTLLVVAFGIFREAWERFREPQAVLAGPMLVVAAIGLVVNLVVALVLSNHDHSDLNVRSAFLHVLGDALSSVGVIAAGVVMLLTGWVWADPLVSVLIGAIILLGSGRLLREALHILVEGAPDDISAGEIERALHDVAGVSNVHDLHIWTVTPGYVALSAHVVLDDPSFGGAEEIQARIRELLAGQFNIRHTTVQLECESCGQGLSTCVGGN
jgi:cobalt-zinc-cadmium efflux system protein